MNNWGLQNMMGGGYGGGQGQQGYGGQQQQGGGLMAFLGGQRMGNRIQSPWGGNTTYARNPSYMNTNYTPQVHMPSGMRSQPGGLAQGMGYRGPQGWAGQMQGMGGGRAGAYFEPPSYVYDSGGKS